ncbi:MULTISPECIES: type II toxin-antitoxin system RelE/ParE family toxin [unclassified Ectothiorhodospira]|uniref:type II toxin-antitoxin system RelE family toxin n=1 Tax=unclassified Ectothiorhodospira TaxID=2684909 RepID=UPI001EE8E124|nr:MULTISPECIES: type II toxin-antitoxin system RelE/ParE family toxin [unclassified Ectothiorhodospira]MCG5516201.1 type II toxin-antitoxin system RelE/ParE family toxin [Ectothiorhodospira sp. 9100]MCG5519646.1 type II toxin-antitoxin system RelE/ParE family toxin [Ectothiorhodospira sp. 9905]
MKAGYVKYRIELKPKAVNYLRSLPKSDAARMANALESLCDNLSGDVKKLTNFSPEYRLRVGNYRALFEIETPDLVMIYRIKHRKEIYKRGT